MSTNTTATALRRTVLRAVAVTAALSGVFLAPAVASAATGSPSAADRCTVTVLNGIGAGTGARMTMSPKGPSVTFEDAGEPGVPIKRLGTLDRARPKLPESAGIYAEILSPSGTAPKLKTKTEGGGAGYATHSFPALPKGCGTGQTGQTSVVPKGSVAAGAEFGTAHDERSALIGGAAIAALGAGAVGYRVLRRRA